MTLDETLKLLRTHEVRAAKFHADGSLSEVVFDTETFEITDLETDPAPAGEPAVPDAYENALTILQRGRDQRNGGQS